MTTEEFIKKAKKIHGDKYDYSKVNYVDKRIKITIICPIHGEYQDTPQRHLSGFTCPKCREEERRLIREKEFIEKATKIHNGKYDYSKVKYINSNIPVTIICPIHGEFQQAPANHLTGKGGCAKCAIISSAGKNRKYDRESFINKAREIHGDRYDYSKVEYVNISTHVTIICPIHGEFKQRPLEHLKGYGCRKCSSEYKKSAIEEFIKRAREVHGNKYDYSKVNYVDSKTKVIIICPVHGEFEQLLHDHLKGDGCKKCQTTEKFIEKARKIHGDKYDYSKVEYINSYTPVTIICPIHGEFQQTPKGHLSGCGCKMCDIDSRKTTKEEFIRKAREIHGDKYDYSKVEYVNCYTPVTIICPIHGEFQQKPRCHLAGHGCKKCSTEKRIEMISLTTEEFIRRAKEVHGDKYDYSKSVYTGYDEKITIICPVHGEFQQRVSSHLEGNGCNLCICDAKRLTKDKFVELAREVHGDRYDYSKVEYTNNKSKVTIVCPIHGEFEQTPNSHLRGAGCPSCSNSRLEDQMEEFLSKNNIKYFHGKTWDWLTYSSYQYVDFYLPDYNIVIECQGIQHFESIEFFGGEKGLIYNQERDKNKRDLCEKHGIKVAYFSNLSTETEKYQYPYKVYEDEYKLFKEELNLIIN